MKLAASVFRMFRNHTNVKNLSKIRGISTSPLRTKMAAQLKNDRLLLKDENNNSIELLYFWLRDHCQCSKCYNPVTNQRQTDLLTIDRKLQPSEVKVDEDKLNIVWPDQHESTYNIIGLFNNLSKTRQRPKGVQKILWNREKIVSLGLPSVPYTEFREMYGFRKHLKNLLTYGINCIVEAPSTYEAIKEISERTGVVQEGVFGRFWKFSSESLDHYDAAYTAQALPAHTDLTYYSQTAGYLVFHCLEHSNGSGGETLLVDGFYALEKLRKENVEAFNFLSEVPMPYQLLDKNDNLYAELPIIQTNPLTQEIVQLRFNTMKRATLENLQNLEMVEKFYDAYTLLIKIIRNKENELYLKLFPGTLLFIDNFRVMHGRSAFTGKRVMSGCYLSRDDLLSKARVLGLL